MSGATTSVLVGRTYDIRSAGERDRDVPARLWTVKRLEQRYGELVGERPVLAVSDKGGTEWFPVRVFESGELQPESVRGKRGSR
ncbi:hypothetical protein [Myxococcus sp. CA040A]|uniref:hypothetical protein n=1 Tax=Myxococcus sp. CA040A TaxID=2741738 RepID=UPI00157AB8E3|nr:hypothetical protein [Myxococcus sp. CA040A]NTX08274.1 hypothetical protein [Myxococcus sp. CA040A]